MSASNRPDVSAQPRETLTPASTVYRWDLDKTYLSTDFDSVRGLLRAAIEKAEDKRTFPGARLLLRELCATQPAGLYILSGSPEQMRKVIEQKLTLDGVIWHGLVLKPSLNRLLRGRFRFLRDQVSYKLRALLASRAELERGQLEVMFGDDAEADAFVYSLYVDLCEGRAGLDVLASVLEVSRAYDDDAAELLELARAVPKGPVCRRIFIHLERIEPSEAFALFGPRVCAFHNYFQPALVLVEDGLLSAEAALRVGLELVRTYAFHPEALAASYVDLSARRVIGQRTAEAMRKAVKATEERGADSGEELTALATAIALTAVVPEGESPVLREPLDYVDLFPTDRARALRAKLRHRLRLR